MSAYYNFLREKIKLAPKTGLTDINGINSILYPHQRDCVKWGLEGGKRAIFAKFGLGKTVISLEMARITLLQKGGKALIVCPLAVKQEFKKDADMLGIAITYCKTQAECEAAETDIIITNYERVRDGDINPSYFTFVCLDEASVLRSVASKTYIQFLKLFASVPYRFVCTATPSPNDYIELLNYAAFLGVMDVSQAKTRFFKRNSEKADNLTLLPHKEKEFWLWVSSWALFITKPSDLGYSDKGYDLPELKINWHLVKSGNNERQLSNGQLTFVSEVAVDLSTAARVKRESIGDRVSKAAEIVATSNEHFIIWHHLESERAALDEWAKNNALNYHSVYGGQIDEKKEELLVGFAEGHYRILATKPSIAGQGCNFQKHCHRAIFLGINYQFNDFIQAIYRIQRFLQNLPCVLDIIYTEKEEHIRRELEAKWRRHDEQTEIMTGIVKEFGLSNVNVDALHRTIGLERIETNGTNFNAIHDDCVLDAMARESNSIHLLHTSVPFSMQYEYSPSYNDFGHNISNEAFFNQMDFVIPEWKRILMPGRLAVIHVKDRLVPGNLSGMATATVYEFSDDVVKAFKKHGFAYMGRITIVTDVVRENAGTYRLGYTQNCIDSTKMGAGLPEYLLLFRKIPTDLSNAYADEPVTKVKEEYTRAQWQIDAHGFWRSSGERLIKPDELARMDLDAAMKLMKSDSLKSVYDYAKHVETAKALERADKLPTGFMVVDPQSWHQDVWADVTRMRGLNTAQGQKGEEQHLCPLPFDIVDRVIVRFSNEGEIVYDPFAGLFTVPYRAIALKRFGIGCELNPVYFKTGVGYCREIEYKRMVPTLFDFMEAVA
ncbi:DNA methyltransferase [Runella sp.]|uniref:DNA methyltransferase n=1 Tax=Runella sp. TaxID=1960881 RepID=UPI003D13C73E